jgi:endonuclease/exonuclease/phosphatase (EEP) superfamily protein YafD
MDFSAYMFLFQVVSSQLIYKSALIALIIVSTFTLISFFCHHAYLELASQFRLQYALVSSVCIILFIIFHSWRLLPLAICCALLNLAYILPYYFVASHQANYSSEANLRLILANVLGSNKNYAALIEAVNEANPDIIVLQEFTEEWWNHTQILNFDYPYYKAVLKPEFSGMALLSRFPLEEVEILTLDDLTHIALRARVNIAGITVSILVLHPPPPIRRDKFLSRNKQFTHAASILKSTTGTRLLIGDLNTTMWSPYFTDLVRESGLRDARRGYGIRPSWPMPLPVFLQIPIDHCLVSDDIMIKGIRTGRRTGSDHRPLIVDMQFKRSELHA